MRLIDIDKLIERYREIDLEGYRKEYADIIEAVIMDLENAPKVRRKRGEWLSVDGSLYLCSRCKWAAGSKYNYCPRCGSHNRLKGEEDGDMENDQNDM